MANKKPCNKQNKLAGYRKSYRELIPLILIMCEGKNHSILSAFR